jgi:hypothetical protein
MGRSIMGASLCAAVAGVLATGCGSKATAYLIVTVDARPAVHDAQSIAVALTNAGTTRMDALVLGQHAFPVTFSVSTPGRTGDLVIAVDALDAAGAIVGHGSAMTTVAATTANLVLDTTDFVVNTDYTGDQFPVDDFEAAGFQLAAQPDGTWTAVFRDSCMNDACNVFARRFDPTGRPVATQAGAGSRAFVVSARTSDDFTEPAAASNAATTLALWNFDDPVPASTAGVACRPLTAAGALAAGQTQLSDDTVAEAVSVAPLASGDFVASWNAIPATTLDNVIRAVIVKSDCTAPGGVQTVSASDMFADRNDAAGSADHVLFTWVVNGDLHGRLASSAGVLATPDAVLVAQTATYAVGHARIVATAGGAFAVAVRWLPQTGAMVPGKIELFQVGADGAVAGSPTLVTDQAGTGGENDEAFGMATRPDGTIMIVWHVCNGGDSCTVSGKIVGATGSDVTPVFAVPTSTGGSQKRPSVIGLPSAFVAVWSDTSGKPPDTSGQAVRARIVYPP